MVIESLWGEEFDIKEEDIDAILKKSRNKKSLEGLSTEKKLKSKLVSIEEKLELIKDDVYNILGKYKDDIITIKDLDTFHNYISKSIENGIIAIDTETGDKDGYGTLNSFDCNIMGLCLYTPGEKAAYIPVKHVNRVTNELLKDQVTESDIKCELQRLIDNNVKCVYHNAPFDIEVIFTTCGIRLPIYWDTMSGAQILDENELKGLKIQYKLHVDNNQDKYDIEHLFKGLPYSIFDPELFALYAATDSLITYRLYMYQLNEFEKEENIDIYNLLKEIEIPILDVIVDMELEGIQVDLDYAKQMSIIYHRRSDEVQKEIDNELLKLQDRINTWKLTPTANERQMGRTGKLGKSKAEQLSDPIDLGSPTQLAILLYDILKVPVVDKKTPRGTGSDILKELSKTVDICKVMLKKREVDILINTFIDAIPTFVQKDNKVHPRFNSTGTKTGRFSSTEPNAQQIPSHDKKIRLIFVPKPGYEIIGADYSGQEMRVLASAANDKEMISAYENKQDIYAKVASLVYHNDVEDNLEFRPGTGELQPDGKKRRSNAKSVALGLNYGMSTRSLAERLNTTLEDAEHIVDGYYGGLSGVKKYTDDSQLMLKEKGYVTDLWGRRRHIPDAQLPEFEVKVDPKFGNNFEFNPLIDSIPHENKSLQAKIKHYESKLAKAKWNKDINVIAKQASFDGLVVKNNRGFISRSLRQCLNARIQGSSASMTKLAMIMIRNDKELKSMDAHLIITVHDEVLMQAPIEYAEKARDRMSELMVKAAESKCSNVPWKCDGYNLKDGWYADECSAEIFNDYSKLVKSMSNDEAYNKICEIYEMFNKESLKKICDGTFVLNKDSLKFGPNYYNGI